MRNLLLTHSALQRHRRPAKVPSPSTWRKPGYWGFASAVCSRRWPVSSNSAACASDLRSGVCLLAGSGAFPEFKNETAAAVVQISDQRGGGAQLPAWRHHSRHNCPQCTPNTAGGVRSEIRPLSAFCDLAVHPLVRSRSRPQHSTQKEKLSGRRRRAKETGHSPLKT